MAVLRYTLHGFQFGAMTVEATASVGDRTIASVKTNGGVTLEIYCSPTGRSVRVFRKGHGEMRVAR